MTSNFLSYSVSSFLDAYPTGLPENDTLSLEDVDDVRKRAQFLQKCKETMWKRWSKEYVWGLRERLEQQIGKQTSYLSVGDGVIIQDEGKKRNAWELEVLEGVVKGRDVVIPGAEIRTTDGNFERAIQQIYPL